MTTNTTGKIGGAAAARTPPAPIHGDPSPRSRARDSAIQAASSSPKPRKPPAEHLRRIQGTCMAREQEWQLEGSAPELYERSTIALMHGAGG